MKVQKREISGDFHSIAESKYFEIEKCKFKSRYSREYKHAGNVHKCEEKALEKIAFAENVN